MWVNRKPCVGYRMGLSLAQHPPQPQTGVETSPFQISVKRLEIDEKCRNYNEFKNILTGCGLMPFMNSIASYSKSATGATYVGSSSGLITIVLMTLLTAAWAILFGNALKVNWRQGFTFSHYVCTYFRAEYCIVIDKMLIRQMMMMTMMMGNSSVREDQKPMRLLHCPLPIE